MKVLPAAVERLAVLSGKKRRQPHLAIDFGYCEDPAEREIIGDWQPSILTGL